MTIDSSAQEYYLQEACGYFALALNELYNYPIYILIGDSGEDEEVTVAHVFCKNTEGNAVDVLGARSIGEINSYYYDLINPRIKQISPEELISEYMGDDKPLFSYSPKEVEEAKEIILNNSEMFMSKINQILQACQLFASLVKKADYSADITDSKKALNNLKSAIEGLDIESFRNFLEDENEEYRYLPGRLIGDEYKDCRIQFQYSNESPREDKFINFTVNQLDDFPSPESIKTPIGQAYLQDSYDLELRLDIDNFSNYRDYLFDNGTISNEFFRFEIEEGSEEDEYINDLDQAYLIGLKKAIIKACSVEQPAFYHEIAHLKRMRKQDIKQFIKQWNPSKAPTKPSYWENVNVKTDTELYPVELQTFSIIITNLIKEFNEAKNNKKSLWENFSFLDYLKKKYNIRSKVNFIGYIEKKLFSYNPSSNYEHDYPRLAVKRISKFYDDMVAGRFKDTLGI